MRERLARRLAWPWERMRKAQRAWGARSASPRGDLFTSGPLPGRRVQYKLWDTPPATSLSTFPPAPQTLIMRGQHSVLI